MSAPGPVYLVVDDSRLHHQMYRLIFGRPGLKGGLLLHAYDGKEGFTTFQSRSDVAMVFLDLNMPGMNGLEFLERRRAENLHPDVPVVLVTTESSAEDEARGLAAGAWAYLRKPFTPEQLEAVIVRARSTSAASATREP